MFLRKTNLVTLIGTAVFSLLLFASAPASAMEHNDMSHENGMSKQEGWSHEGEMKKKSDEGHEESIMRQGDMSHQDGMMKEEGMSHDDSMMKGGDSY